jgi:K+-transporting ATPase ATPase C chain
MNPQLRPAIRSFLALTAITGIAYPVLLGVLSRAFFPGRAEGSLVHGAGRVVGSELIGQGFTAPGDFWGRPSATLGADGIPLPYNAANSGGSAGQP